jgi:hypothetical protein
VLNGFAHTSTIERGSDEEISEPMIVIAKVIEVSKRRKGKGTVALNLLAVRMKVPQKRHPSEGLTGRIIRPMKVLHLIENTVLIVYQALNLITRSIRLWERKSEPKLKRFGLDALESFGRDTVDRTQYLRLGCCNLVQGRAADRSFYPLRWFGLGAFSSLFPPELFRVLQF